MKRLASHLRRSGGFVARSAEEKVAFPLLGSMGSLAVALGETLEQLGRRVAPEATSGTAAFVIPSEKHDAIEEIRFWKM